jgi:type IV pilus assembly protein PilM
MIKNLFIPQRVGNYFLFSTRILGFDIGKTTVKATLILARKKEITIEKNFDVPLAANATVSYQDQVADAIKIILAQCPPVDSIISALPSSNAIFKELKLPFIGISTIKKVIGYEVEPLLPFPLQDSVIDCIVTKELPEEKSSEVLVAAVQNQYMAQHLALFEAAGVQPEKVTIDIFALYGLYKIIPMYGDQKGAVVLLEIEPSGTRMAYIYDGQLRFIRTLPKGLIDQARLIAQRTHTTEQEAMEQIIRFGLEPDNNAMIGPMKESFSSFFNDILFTLQSFVIQSKPSQSINKIIIFGTSATIKGLPELITDLSHIKTEIFSINTLIHNGYGVSAKSAVPSSNLVSLATALPLSATADFNLRQKEFALSQTNLFAQQFIAGCALAGLIVGGLLFNTFWQTRKLKQEAYHSEQDAILALKEHIKKMPADVGSLEEALGTANNIVNQEEKVWSAFSATARTNFLEYLIELTKLNKNELGLEIEKLTMTPDTIVLKGQVRDYPELATLERELKESKLFSYVEPVHETKFSMTLRLAKKTKRER